MRPVYGLSMGQCHSCDFNSQVLDCTFLVQRLKAGSGLGMRLPEVAINVVLLYCIFDVST